MTEQIHDLPPEAQSELQSMEAKKASVEASAPNADSRSETQATDTEQSVEGAENRQSEIAEAREKIQSVGMSDNTPARNLPERGRQIEDFLSQCAEKKTTDLIGAGAEKTVYGHPSDPSKVVAEYHAGQTAEYILDQYYMAKTLHLLDPQHFPDAHFAYAQPTLIVFDKVQPPAKMNRVVGAFRRFTETRKVRNLLSQLDMTGDYNSSNFVFDSDGGLKYVDSTGGSSDLGLLKGTIDKKFGGKPEDRESGLKYVDKMSQIKQMRLSGKHFETSEDFLDFMNS